MTEKREQFWALYLTRFAEGFGFITLITLLPYYINTLDPSDTTILGLTISAGLIIGLYTTGFTLAQTVAVVPLAWAGDRFDKRTVLLGVLGIGVGVYALFPLVDSSASFIAIRALQGVAVTGAGLMTLSLVGQIADVGTRANYIGKANAASFGASILGSISAGTLYDAFGFGPIFLVIVCIMVIAWAGTFWYLEPDGTRIEGFPFTGLALNRRILTLSSFRFQYAFSVTLVRTWIPIFAGVSAAEGGLAYGGFAVALTVVAEKFTNMCCQPFTGRLSDGYGRALFVFSGGAAYGVIALFVPLSPAIGTTLGLPSELVVSLPALMVGVALPAWLPYESIPGQFVLIGEVSPAFFPLIALSGLLGIADSFREPASMALFADEGTEEGGVASSFGIRELVWRPGSVIAPLLGGWLMVEVSMASVFYVGGAFALTGVLTFLIILVSFHGRRALTEW
ncbi:MFS transporter [Natronorubrum bangense]|uniref:Major facilitator superfamily protein n=2 Tax=Natronorubrum bangense TaxID=61858 RepID=L9WIQ2_9EURY|nr:MFS transporter [Natronorubrum bangense]ELY49096.1 major facilitator superfamily protein [Natronorubrum bangense JCM 10635]QCC57006.1 MFS transporter [Natronorubrum bangense]